MVSGQGVLCQLLSTYVGCHLRSAPYAMEVHERHAEPWRVTLVDTGELTMTGGRLKRVRVIWMAKISASLMVTALAISIFVGSLPSSAAR